MTEGQDAGAGAAFSFLGDQPFCEGSDPLGYDEIATELAELVLRSRESTPFALGIEGAWGTGKSTLMERLRRRLADDPSVETVTFNAWTAAEHGVVEGLVKSVLDKLDPNVMRRALRNAQLVSWARVALNVAAGWLRLGSVVDLFWSATAIDPQGRNQIQGLVERSVAVWAQRDAGVPDGRLLCVTIDDLDRCPPRAAMEVLEAIKLYLGVPGIVFVVGYDQTIVSELVLRERGYGDAIKERDYLEKFIQIKYRIPRPSAERSRALVGSLLRASSTDDLFGDEELAVLVDRNARNPRRIKRFINDFVLAYGLDPGWRDFQPGVLIRLQLLNAYFEEFARLLPVQDDPDPLVEFAEYREARERLRRFDLVEAAATEAPPAFKSHGLSFPEVLRPDDAARLLRQLEDVVPESFLTFVDDQELCSLAESLRSAADWERLRRRLLERELVVEVEREEAAEAIDRPGVLTGLSVLWVDDQHESNRRLVETLRRLGAELELADDSERAHVALARRRFDALVSDIDRDGDAKAGFDALTRFREEGVAPARVVFFAARVTRARAARAKELGATLTNLPGDLIAQLAAVATPGARRSFVLNVVGVSGDDEVVERLRTDLGEAMPDARHTTATSADGVPLGDVLVVVLGERWRESSSVDLLERYARSEHGELVGRLRVFAGTGAPMLFALTPDAPPEAVDVAAEITAPEPPLLLALGPAAATWDVDVARIAEVARTKILLTRRQRGMPA
jgi:CheY-like chemotaxis protein